MVRRGARRVIGRSIALSGGRVKKLLICVDLRRYRTNGGDTAQIWRIMLMPPNSKLSKESQLIKRSKEDYLVG